MIPYWLLWAFFFCGVMLSQRQPRAELQLQLQYQQYPGWMPPLGRPGLSLVAIVGLIGMTLMIGLRYDVGGDWNAYEFIFKRAGYRTFDQSLLQSDPGYAVLNWLVQQVGGEVWLVNLICAAITVWGLAALVRREPNPWLSLLLAVPYLIVVVAMGYTRQAAALGLLMLGLANLLRTGSLPRFIFWVALAALFHKSAVVCLPMVAFLGNRRRIVDLALLATAGLGLYTLLLQDSVDTLVKNYIGARYSSAGAAIRVSMSLLPGIIFLLFRRRFGFSETEEKLWRNFSLVAIGSAIALAISPSSTAVDRIALYLLPIQFVVLARIPGTLVQRGFGTVLVSAYSAAVLFTWLTFGVHAQHWLPYRTWLDS
ncbi:EpsG family protein [Sphingomonas sp. LHG3443-2]|uniref:EpsG family protein n=1 Tax=Sphingomonas sp. LHG3443-2 TaxID=2804639 RepID=UPI003CE7A9AD